MISTQRFLLPRLLAGRNRSEFVSFDYLLMCTLYSVHVLHVVMYTIIRPNVIKFKLGGVSACGVKNSRGEELIWNS